jgi:pyruvate/2-oxoacid:ferredoxin oxidoreductase alpha subunit
MAPGSSVVNLDDEAWGRRLAKRVPEAQRLRAKLDKVGAFGVSVPDPFDRTASKRHWEKLCEQVRIYARELSSSSASSSSEASGQTPNKISKTNKMPTTTIKRSATNKMPNMLQTSVKKGLH